MSLLKTFIIQFLIGFFGISLVLFLHELAHFLTAKLVGVSVDEFSLGMGPKLFSIHGRKTIFTIRLLPLGGSTKMNGSTDLIKALRDDAKEFERCEEGSFFTSSPFKRFLIFFSGPIANILLAFLLFIIISYIPVERIVNEPLIANAIDYPFMFNIDIKQDNVMPGDKIISLDNIVINTFEDAEDYLIKHNNRPVLASLLRGNEEVTTLLSPKNGKFGLTLYQKPIIARVTPDSPFKENDEIISVNGDQVNCTYDLYKHSDEVMDITVLRDGSYITINLSPMKEFPFAWKSDIAITPKPTMKDAIILGLNRTQNIIRNIISTLLDVVTGKLKDTRNEITGPTRAASQIGSITTLSFKTSLNTGIRTFLYLISTVSVSIGVINLLPIPSFDGGQMLVNLYLLVFKRKLKPKTYIVFHILGLVISTVLLFLLYFVDIKFYLS